MTPPRIVLAGGVFSTRVTLERLLAHGAPVVGVLGLAPPDPEAAPVSGYARLDDLCRDAAVPFVEFERINAPEVVAQVRAWAPDLLFVVGLSQLVGGELMALPGRATVGFHPTALPRGRGRAPIAWLILEEGEGAASFFVIDESVDHGPLLVQERFPIGPEDDAAAVADRIVESMGVALDRWLPRLMAGEWEPAPQDHRAASWYGRRTPLDGLIDWGESAEHLERLVRASTQPHPGAFTHREDRRLRIWNATVVDRSISGVLGRVVELDGGLPVVQCGEGHLRLDEVAADDGQPVDLRVGQLLGYRLEHELYALRERMRTLEARLDAMAAESSGAAEPTGAER